jgi:AraC-like DNA-binding protein
MSNSDKREGDVSQESTVGCIHVTDLLDALGALGVDATALRTSVGLGDSDLRDPEARLPSSLILELLERASWQLHDPLVGLHAGAQVRPRGPLFYLLLSSPRVGEGLRLLSRFARVSLDTQELRIARSGGVVNLTFDPGDPAIQGSYHACDYIMGAILSSLRRAVPGFRALAVELAHPRVGEQQESERAFGCAVRFACAHNVLRFPDSMLRGTPSGANSAIAEQIGRYASALLERSASNRIQDRVSGVVRQLLVDGIRADRSIVAKRLHMSERTLQRQLLKESTSFKAVRDRVRAETSRALLSNESLKVEAVGLCVGFADAASFTRAFTRWAGHSPARFRERLGRKRNPPKQPVGH